MDPVSRPLYEILKVVREEGAELGPREGDETESRGWYARFEDAEERQDIRALRQLAEEANALPDSPRRLLRVACCLRGIKAFEDALAVFKRVTAVQKRNCYAWAQRALMLERLGRVDEAADLLGKKRREFPDDEELEGIHGRVLKTQWLSQWQNEGTLAARRQAAFEARSLLLDSQEAYERIYDKTNGQSYYNGVNAMALAALAADLLQGCDRVADTAAVLSGKLLLVEKAARGAEDSPAEAFWARATLGDIAVLRGDAPAAEALYRDAVGACSPTASELDSVRQQLEIYCDLGFKTVAAEAGIGVLAAAIEALPDPKPEGFEEIVTRNPRVCASLREVAQVSATTHSVLITGETGTGKELLARAIHDMSPRRDRKYAVVNCAAIPHALLASELFGHVKGAFADASRDRKGRLAEVDGGTIFLDEIGDMPKEDQTSLLRFLETGEIQRVGADGMTHLNVRVVAATNRPEGLRADLRARLGSFCVELPPLRERRDDIPLLVAHFLPGLMAEMGRVLEGVSRPAMLRLMSHDWQSGNIRELRNALGEALVGARGRWITPFCLAENIADTPLRPGVRAARVTAPMGSVQRLRAIATRMLRDGKNDDRWQGVENLRCFGEIVGKCLGDEASRDRLPFEEWSTFLFRVLEEGIGELHAFPPEGDGDAYHGDGLLLEAWQPEDAPGPASRTWSPAVRVVATAFHLEPRQLMSAIRTSRALWLKQNQESKDRARVLRVVNILRRLGLHEMPHYVPWLAWLCGYGSVEQLEPGSDVPPGGGHNGIRKLLDGHGIATSGHPDRPRVTRTPW